mmetsp:Transcript_50447/g.132474  ORF Transcript_50447/g.132474 Transcript_50447/m.132474 type:complete len:94 (-) Transcript_50447:455-736(-)
MCYPGLMRHCSRFQRNEAVSFLSASSLRKFSNPVIASSTHKSSTPINRGDSAHHREQQLVEFPGGGIYFWWQVLFVLLSVNYNIIGSRTGWCN